VLRDEEARGDAFAALPYNVARPCTVVVRLFRGPIFSVTQEDTVEEDCAGMIEHESDESAARREQQSLFRILCRRDRVDKGDGIASENEGITVVEQPLEQLACESEES